MRKLEEMKRQLRLEPDNIALDEAIYRYERKLKKNKKEPICLTRLCKLYREEVSAKEASARLGYSLSTITKYYKELEYNTLVHAVRAYCYSNHLNMNWGLIQGAMMNMSISQKIMYLKIKLGMVK